MSTTPPSINPADTDTLEGLILSAFLKLMQGIDTCLPVQVIAATPDRKFVQVQPQIKMLDTDNAPVSRGAIAKIPVKQWSLGGYVISSKPKEGDQGWAIAADNDISLFLRGCSESPPNTLVTRNFANAFFLPDIFKDFTIADTDTDNMVIQSLDGTVCISLSTDSITLRAPQGFIFDGPAVFNDTVEFNDVVTANETVNANGGLSAEGGGDNSGIFTGNLRVTNNITAGGTITPGVPPLILIPGVTSIAALLGIRSK